MAAYLEHRHLCAAEVPVERFFMDVAIARLVCVHATFTAQDAERVARLAERHADLKLGTADAHTMILAAPERYGTTRVLTFDQKHFRAVKPPQGGVFTVLPADL